jgi:putative tryptophan/tyrosine transport system substrate-binding protein
MCPFAVKMRVARTILGLLGMLIAVSPALALASDPPRIGILFPGPAGPAPSLQAFEKALSELGWRHGDNVLLDYRYAEGQLDRLPEMAEDLVNLPVNIIVAFTGEAVVAAYRTTRSVPIVSATGDGDFVAMGLIASWDRPGGNVTGMNLSSAEAARKRVEVFKQALPSLARLAVLVHAPYPSSPQLLSEMEAVAKQLDIQVYPLSISAPEELGPAFVTATQAGAHAVSTLQGPFFLFQRKPIIELAVQHKLPLAMGEASAAEAGALLQVSPDVPGCAARSASVVDRLLRGANPAELPVERFSHTQSVFNLKVARSLGMTIEPAATQGARVIE